MEIFQQFSHHNGFTTTANKQARSRTKKSTSKNNIQKKFVWKVLVTILTFQLVATLFVATVIMDSSDQTIGSNNPLRRNLLAQFHEHDKSSNFLRTKKPSSNSTINYETETKNEDLPMVIRFYKCEKNKPRNVDCDIPCQVCESDLPIQYLLNNPARIDGTPYKFDPHTMEGPVYYPDFQAPAAVGARKPFNRFSATTSFKSDIPLSYYSPEIFNIQTPSIDYDSAIKGASFIAHNCESRNNREDIVQKLINSTTQIRIDSLGDCLHNADPPRNLTIQNKTLLMQQYLFHLAFENQRADDYITEKLWGTLESGSLPVYFGPSNIREHIPPNSVILVDDFDSVEDLAQFLNQVSRNKTLYESFHIWRTKPLPDSFHKKYDFTKTHSLCRMCRFAYARKYGYGWDGQKQQIDDPSYPSFQQS